MALYYVTAVHDVFHVWIGIYLNIHSCLIYAVMYLLLPQLSGILSLKPVIAAVFASVLWISSSAVYDADLSERNFPIHVIAQKMIYLRRDIQNSLDTQMCLIRLQTEDSEQAYINSQIQIRNEACNTIVQLNDIREVHITSVRYMIHSPRMEGIAKTYC